MIVALSGSNHFLIQAELKRFVADFVKDYTDMGLQRLDGEEAEYDRIREALQSLPFLASKKLVVLRSPSANKEFVEKVEKLFSDLPETTDVIIHEPKLDKRSVYYRYLRKNTDYKEFNELDENALVKWLIDQAILMGGTLKNSDARFLIERMGLNQQLLSSELTKLLTYNLVISRESIELLTEPTAQSTIFQLVDAAFAGNAKKALQIYAEQRAAKVEPIAIIGMLAWQLHILAVIITAGSRSDAAIASEAKISPYVIRKSRSIARDLSLSQIKQLIGNLLELDVSLKTTSINADDALQHYLLTLSQ